MFYRFLRGGCRAPVDLDDAYKNLSCFIAGGAPSLGKENLDRLREPGVNLLAINNTASLFQGAVTFWLGGDKPKCYSERILKDPGILKFAVISRRDELVDGRPWKELPSTFFFGTNEKFDEKNFLSPHRDFAWWKNTFFLALQLAYRLGFRKVYLIGCSFNAKTKKDYAYDVKLSDAERDWNDKLYNNSVVRMRNLKPTFEAGGLEIISATPDSKLNGDFPTMTFDEAVDDALSGFPKEYGLDKVVHSSALKKT